MTLLASILLCLGAAPQDRGPGSYNEDPGNLFGYALAAVGDVDGDRVQDFVVGDPMADGPYSGHPNLPGRAWLVSTGKCRKLLEFRAGARGDEFGQAVAGPGDVDGDSIPDVLVASTPFGEHRSLIHAYSGRSGALLHTIEIPAMRRRDYTGWANLCGLGDLDEDSCADYAVAWFRESEQSVERGEVRIVSGKRGRILTRCLETGRDVPPFRSIASAGDMDHDGFQDLVASREGGASTIEVWSVRRRVRLHSIRLPDLADRFPITAGQDIDLDGTPDLVVGLEGLGENSCLLAFSGATASPIRAWRFRPCRDPGDIGELSEYLASTARVGSSEEPWNFGEFVELLADVDADRVPDLIVRAPNSGAYVSRVWILSGAEDRVIHTWKDGPWEGSFFGVSSAPIGDVDRDGVGDVLIGEASWKAGGDFPGYVRIYSGRSGRLILRWKQWDIRFRKR